MTKARHLRPVPAEGRQHRTLLYRRVSAVMGRTGEQFISPDLQLAAMRDLARRRGLTEIGVIDDIDVSGRTFARQGIQRVLEMARRREVDVIALYDLSRLGRNTAESLRVIAELRELGVAVMSTSEQIDDTPEGQFQLGIWLGMAQLYSDQVARRWSQVVAHRTERGLHHGQPPLGYVHADRRIVPDAVVGPAVRRVFVDYAAGMAIAEIGRRFRASTGLPTPTSSLKRLMRNPVYVGQVRAQGVAKPGQHDRLVDDRTWRKVQRRLDLDAGTPPRTLDGRNSLAGLVVCDGCDRAAVQGRDSAGRARLRCSGRLDGRCDTGVGRPAVEAVEAEVFRQLLEHLAGKRANVGAAATRKARVASAKVNVQQLRREIAKTETALGRLAADRARRDVTANEYELGAAALRESLTALRSRLDEAERMSVQPVARAGVEDAARALARRWSKMTPAERHRAFRTWIRQVRVRPPARHGDPVDAARVEVVFL